MTSRSREDSFLARIISTVGSSLDLDEVLAAVVALLSDASAVRACFVYLVDETGDRLVLRAAGEPYAHLVGQISFTRGESLAWWSLEHREPAFIREGALDDPRTKEVPEFEEDRFQSLVAVPILSRAAAEIGAITAHTEAPREFTDDEVSFLVTVARLVGGAIENARLYDETRTRVEELEQLTALAEAIAQAPNLDDLLPIVARDARALLHASSCHLYLLEAGTEELEWRASDPADAEARRTLGLAELGPELARGKRAARVAVPLVAGDELVGLLVARDTTSIELARAVASQAAVGVRKLQLIERLTERNLIKEVFEELEGGRSRGDLVGRAARLGCDIEAAHVVLTAAPADDALERALAGAFPGSLLDRREESLRALLRVPAGGTERLHAAVRRVHTSLGAPIAVGMSEPCRDPAGYPDAFEQARGAQIGASVLHHEPSVVAFEELGAYKYLLGIALDRSSSDATIVAIEQLARYDDDRGASLLPTLEEFLRRHGSISATADTLHVHQNTLRQRLRRIQEVSGIDLRRDDWLMVEIAVRLVRLRLALDTANPNTSRE
jgi:GAF domain-containing protein